MKAFVEQSDRQKAGKLNELQKRKERTLNDDINRLMGDQMFRRFAYWLIWSECGINDGVFNMGIKDGMCSALIASRMDGRRDVAIDVTQKLQSICPDKYAIMIKESVSALEEELLLNQEVEKEMNRD